MIEETIHEGWTLMVRFRSLLCKFSVSQMSVCFSSSHAGAHPSSGTFTVKNGACHYTPKGSPEEVSYNTPLFPWQRAHIWMPDFPYMATLPRKQRGVI